MSRTLAFRLTSVRGFAVFALAIGAVPDGRAGVALPGQAITDPVVRECLERTLPARSVRQLIRFTTSKDGESLGESAATVYWRRFEDGGSRALLRLTAPTPKVGLALLAEENADNTLRQDVTVYLPELRAVRRISGAALSGSMFGTDFSYTDFVQLQGMLHQRAVRRLDDAIVHERAAYTIETVPQHADAEYSRIETFIDQQWCVAVEMRFYGLDGALVKDLVINPESVREISNRHVPHEMVLTDHQHNGRTDLVIDEIEIDPDLNPNLFTAAELRRGR